MAENDVIADNRTAILARIAASAKMAGRSPTDICLIAVSKQQTSARVSAMLAAGQRVFGENRVQEAAQRWQEDFADFRTGLELHLVGGLQSNKAVQAVALFDVIHSLDRESLATALVRAAEKVGRLPKLFVQVNSGYEPQKGGVLPQNLDSFLNRLRDEYRLEIAGLMVIPPVGEAVSAHFWQLQVLAQEHGLACLSMGMSADFELAIEFGATHVRIGSALFGARAL